LKQSERGKYGKNGIFGKGEAARNDGFLRAPFKASLSLIERLNQDESRHIQTPKNQHNKRTD